MKLSRYEQETIICYNEEEETANVYTHNNKLAVKLKRLAEKYPEAKFITAHSATSWQMVDEAAAETGAHDNLYFDVAGSILLYGCLEEMVERLGVGKILFGTDNPFIDPRPGLGRLLMARISDDDKRQILGLNAKRIFGL